MYRFSRKKNINVRRLTDIKEEKYVNVWSYLSNLSKLVMEDDKKNFNQAKNTWMLKDS